MRAIPYDQLRAGFYEVNVTDPDEMCDDMVWGCPELSAVFEEYSIRVNEAADEGHLPDVQALLIVEDWQAGLKKITPRILWTDEETGDRKSYERHIFLHRDRNRSH